MGFFGLSRDFVFLRADVIRSLVEKRGQSLEDVANGWFPLPSTDEDVYPPAPSRAAIYSWISKGFPSIESGPSRYQILAFCAQLDVDPLAVFDYRKNGYFSRFATLRKAVQRGIGGLGAFAPIFELFEPDEHWPSDKLSSAIWGRKWFAAEFDNQYNYQSNDYALVKVKFKQATNEEPRAAHIAYRRWDTRSRDTMWRYYGTVIGIDDRIELYNENAVHLKMDRVDDSEIAFRTYFGGRPVQFRIASLHDFDEEIVFPFNDMSVVGFNW